MKLGNVAEFKRGIPITRKDVVEGDVPVVAGGRKPAYFHNKFNREGETIAVAWSGAHAGFVSFWTIPVWLSDSFSIHADDSILLQKYLYLFLKKRQHHIHRLKKGAGIPHVYIGDLQTIPISPPPSRNRRELLNDWVAGMN